MYQQSSWYDLQFLRYRVWQTEIGNCGSFFALYLPPLKIQKIRIFKKWKKIAGDIIILHKCTQNHNHMKYNSDRSFSHFRPFFLPFYPSNNPEEQNFKKKKKMSGNIIISQKCTINDNRMMHDSWYMKRVREFFAIFGYFLSFTPLILSFTHLTAQKIKMKKKDREKHLEILSFYISVPKIMIICYTVPEIWHVTDVIIFSFWAIFVALLPP